MRIEEIIKREDGSRVRIVVTVTTYRDKFNYEFSVVSCLKGKRTWTSPHSNDDHKWRALDMEGRQEYKKKKLLTIVTPIEVHTLAMRLWKTLEPSDNFSVTAY
tara:strand:+ start:554 stop:862 length:309 start_codon:yes stop_codon:yes gene_type:complete